MGNPQTETVVVSAPRRRPLFMLGVLLFLLGPVLYAVQFSMKHLVTPWYLPILATIGVLFMLVSVQQRRGVLRIAVLALFTLMCGFEWFMLLVGTRVPPYTGPAQLGLKLPAFNAALADGQTFTDKDLEKNIPTVLVFFRGRW